MMPLAYEKYRLSKEENKKRFQNKILPKLKEDYNFSPQEKPIAHFTAGIPGAGKSGVVKEWEKMHKGIILIDADELRKEHPKNPEIQKVFGAKASCVNHPDASKWVKQLQEEARNHRAHYILDGTMKNPQNAQVKINKALENGYDVKLTMVAVHKYEALQGVFNRYAGQYEKNPNQARFVEPKLVEDAYVSIANTVDVVDKMPLKDFKIVTRDKEIVYDSKDMTYQQDAKTTLTAYNHLGNWKPQRVEKLTQNWEKTIDKLKEVKAPQEIQNSAKTVYKAFRDQTKEHKQENKVKSPEDKVVEKLKAFTQARDATPKAPAKSQGRER